MSWNRIKILEYMIDQSDSEDGAMLRSVAFRIHAGTIGTSITLIIPSENWNWIVGDL